MEARFREACGHLQSLTDFPPSRGADALSVKKALEEAQKKMEVPHGSSS